MRKYWLAACLLLALVLAASPAHTALAQGIRVPRVISVVYDDSGSMDSYDGSLGKAGYANYAMKAFIALLDRQDVLYVTFMTRPSTPYRLDLSQGAEAAIRELDLLHMGSAETPIETVRTAIDTLKSQPAPNDASLYWLVIFTDGVFGSSTSFVANPDIDAELGKLLGHAMPNGTLPQACYVAIGGDALRPQQMADGLTVYPETGFIDNSEGILDVMRTMADKISGRARIGAGKIQESGTTVRFTTDLPSFSIAVLQQKDVQPWLRMTDAAGAEVAGSQVAVRVTGFTGELVGWAGNFTGSQDGVLPAGTYELTFSAPPSDLVIMTEPALVLDLTVTAANGGTDDLSLVEAGKADIQGVLHLWNDTAPVDPALLPAGTAYSLAVKRDGKTVSETGDAAMRLTDVDISGAETAVLGSVELPGVGTVMASRTIHIPEYSLDLAREDGGRFTLRELVGNTKGIVATILRDGAPVSKEDAEKLNIQATSPLPISVTRMDTGSFLLVPSLAKLQPLTSYGDVAATLAITGAAGKTKNATVSWHIQTPILLAEGASLGPNTMARTELWKNAVLMDSIQTLDDAKTAAQAQIVGAFRILLDGLQLTAQELDEWGRVTVIITGDAREHYLCGIKILPDGTVLSAPYSPLTGALSSPWLRWLDSWRLWPADGIIQCTLENGASASLMFRITLEPWYLILLNMVLPLLLLVLLLGYLFKRRFARGAAVRFVSISKAGESLTSGAETWREEKLGRLNGWSFVPYARARAKAGGLTFYAGRTDFVLVRQEQLLKESGLIAQKFCTHRGGFAMQLDSENRRPIGTPEENAVPGRFSVLAKNDVLILTGDNRGGRAYIYQ